MKVIKIRLETNEVENKEKYIFEIKKMKKKNLDKLGKKAIRQTLPL